MGETGGRNEHAWQTTMYEILAEYHAGVHKNFGGIFWISKKK